MLLNEWLRLFDLEHSLAERSVIGRCATGCDRRLANAPCEEFLEDILDLNDAVGDWEFQDRCADGSLSEASVVHAGAR